MIFVYDFKHVLGTHININVTTFRLCKYVQPKAETSTTTNLGTVTGVP